MRDIILFGGTFDPPHVGHLLMAHLALEQTGADEMWFLPAPVPPHKVDEKHTAYPLRVRYVAAMVADVPNMKVNDIEASLPKPSYTVDTIGHLQKEYTEHRFRFLMGADSLAQFPTWHRAEELAKRIEFIVAVRHGHPFSEALATVTAAIPCFRAEVLEMPLVDVSSTFLRDRRKRHLPLCGLVPPPVLKLWLESNVD